MSRARKIAVIAAAGVLAAILFLFVAVIVVVSTPWFRNFVRDRIVAEIGEATGGRAELGEFALFPARLGAQLVNFILRGTEPPGAPPLFRARLIDIELKAGAALLRKLAIQSLLVEQPEIHLRIEPDGSTNLPESGAPTGPRPLETLMDLALGRFEAFGGLLSVADRRTPLDVRGENLNARLTYHSAGPRYTGGITAAPVHFTTGGNPSLPVHVDIPLEVTREALTITNARFDAPDSHLEASARLTDLRAPHGDVRLNGRLALPELARSFMPRMTARTQGTPPLDVNATASLDGNQARFEMLRLVMGRSSLNAAGALTNLQAFTGTFHFSGDFTMEELKNLLNLPQLGTGTVHVTGTATTGPRGLEVKAKFSAGNVALNVGGARLTGASVSSDVHVFGGDVSLTNIRISALGGSFTGSAQIINRKRFVVEGELASISLREAAAAYGLAQPAWSGAVSGPMRIEGTLSGPIADQLIAQAKLSIAPGGGGIAVSGNIDVAYNGPAGRVSFGNSFLALPATRVDFSGDMGNRLSVRAVSRDLNDLLPVLALFSSAAPRTLPVELAAGGEAVFDGTVAGSLADPRIEGRLSLTGFAVNGRKFDRLTAGIEASSIGAAIRGAVLSQDRLEAKLDASIGLVNWKPQPSSPVSASASLSNAPVESLLAIAGRSALPVTGTLAANAEVSGMYGSPLAGVALTIRNGAVWGEPFEAVQARLSYTNGVLQLTSAQLTGPYGRLAASAAYRHRPGDFRSGRLAFRINASALQLASISAVSARQPGLSGVVEITAAGAGAVQMGAPLPFLLSSLDAKLTARSLVLDNRPAGSLLVTAQTRGSDLTFDLQSDIAGATVRGRGAWRLAGDYPIQANFTFSPVELGAIARLASGHLDRISRNVSGLIAGSLSVSGPMMRPRDLSGKLVLSRLELTSLVQPAAGAQPWTLRNDGPITATLSQSEFRLLPARLAGPSTALSVSGGMFLNKGNALDFQATGRIGLELLNMFDPDISSSGVALLNAAVRGTLSKPDVNGKLQLQNASLSVADFPNSISNANGTILFSGTQAVIENITGETGGGAVSLTGRVHYGGPVTDFRLQATAREVRIDYPAQVSTKVNAKLAFAGTTESSVLSGNVSVLEVMLRLETDLAALLAPGTPRPAPVVQTGLLGGMRLDVRIETVPGVQFFSALTQDLQAEGDLHVRGTPSQPGMLGRITLTQGEILFFGNRYTVSRGTISFFNPQRIEPIVDVALETRARGVNVTVLVSGPVDRLKLSYSSDPPLAFSDVVGLLSTGQTLSGDPLLAARQQSALPQQGIQQLGASTVLSQAIATPVAGRLQRLFGISQLTINPQVIGTAITPETQITLEQQISTNLIFTYVQTLTEANPQTIRVEWAINPRWSAVGIRQQDGRFGIDLFYKKSFR
ncbi:MAG TPA: translocation/assembly module TamB domain-containing protein [Bryobacteraceae bacterium]|nr:translocation/assembly module TamB domain-containing protein [Bryobacteraceae bacterium]